MSMAAADVGTLTSAAGLTDDVTGFSSLLAMIQGLTMAAGARAWAPGDPTLPGDWPPDDPSPTTEFHAAFQYTGTVVIDLSASPVPVLAWVEAGGVGGTGPGVSHGIGGVGGTHLPVTDWILLSPTSSALASGDVLRFSMSPGEVSSLTYANGNANDAAGLQGALSGNTSYGIITSTVSVWAPGDPTLPADWPTSTEPNLAGNWHVELTVTHVATGALAQVLAVVSAAWRGLIVTIGPPSGVLGELPGSFWDSYFPGASSTPGALLFLYGWNPTSNAWTEIGPAFPGGLPGDLNLETGTCTALALVAGSATYFGSASAATYALAFYLAPNASNWSYVIFAPLTSPQIAALTYDASGCPTNAPAPTMYAQGYEPV